MKKIKEKNMLFLIIEINNKVDLFKYKKLFI